MKWFDDAVITSSSSSFVNIITNFEADLILPVEFTFDAVLYAKRMADGFQISEHEFRYVYALDSGYGQPAYIWFIYNDSLNTITSVTKQLFDAISYSTLTNILSGYVTSSSLSSTLSNYAQVSTLASVATSGSYNDLTDKPSIPTVDYPVTDVQVDGVSVVSNKVASIIMPTVPDFEYHDGDTYVNSGYFTSTGYITNGKKEITFTIILPKLLTNITSVTVNKLQGLIRGVGGYVNGTSDVDYASASGYTINTYIGAPNAVTIMILKSSEHSNSTNNTPINFSFAVNGLQLTFNE